MVDKIELDWQKEIPLRCRHCDGCRDITPLAYNAYHLALRVKELEEQNANIHRAARDAMRLGGDKVVEAVRKWCGA